MAGHFRVISPLKEYGTWQDRSGFDQHLKRNLLADWWMSSWILMFSYPATLSSSFFSMKSTICGLKEKRILSGPTSRVSVKSNSRALRCLHLENTWMPVVLSVLLCKPVFTHHAWRQGDGCTIHSGVWIARCNLMSLESVTLAWKIPWMEEPGRL